MLVSPDYNTLNKAPNIDGMMVYRKDNNKLYVKSEGNLKELAEKKVISKQTAERLSIPGRGLSILQQRSSNLSRSSRKGSHPH